MSPPESKSAAAGSLEPSPETIEPDAVAPASDEYEPPDGSGGGDPDDPLDAKRMTLLEHLSELRVRLRNAAIAFVVAMLGSFFFVQRFFEVLTRPVMRGVKRAHSAGLASRLTICAS